MLTVLIFSPAIATLETLTTGARVISTGHQGFVNGTGFDPTGRYLYSVSIEGTLNVWDMANLDAGPATHNIHSGPVNDLSCADTIATAGFDGTVKVSSPTGALLETHSPGYPVHAVALLNKELFFGGSSGEVQRRQVQTFTTLGIGN